MNSNNQSLLIHETQVLYENRCCNQGGSVLFCGGIDKSNNFLNRVLEVKVPSFEVFEFPSMVKQRCFTELIVVNSDIMAIGGDVSIKEDFANFNNSVEIYSSKRKHWQEQYIQIPGKKCFCYCFFMKNIFVIGECNESSYESLKFSFTYSYKIDKWKQIAKFNVARHCAACTIFEGKIVVTGGDIDNEALKSVEAYDYYENKWTYLPDMIEERRLHATVSMGNKMFVIGGYKISSCETFDSHSRIFTSIKSFSTIPIIDNSYLKAVCLGNYIIVLNIVLHKVYMYDVDKQMWSNVDSDFCKNLKGSNCVKYFTQ